MKNNFILNGEDTEKSADANQNLLAILQKAIPSLDQGPALSNGYLWPLYDLIGKQFGLELSHSFLSDKRQGDHHP
jgi:hypothetical protein